MQYAEVVARNGNIILHGRQHAAAPSLDPVGIHISKHALCAFAVDAEPLLYSVL